MHKNIVIIFNNTIQILQIQICFPLFVFFNFIKNMIFSFI